MERGAPHFKSEPSERKIIRRDELVIKTTHSNTLDKKLGAREIFAGAE
jgi:hypothetical protein